MNTLAAMGSGLLIIFVIMSVVAILVTIVTPVDRKQEDEEQQEYLRKWNEKYGRKDNKK